MQHHSNVSKYSLVLHFFPINIAFRKLNNTIHGILGIYLGLAEER